MLLRLPSRSLLACRTLNMLYSVLKSVTGLWPAPEAQPTFLVSLFIRTWSPPRYKRRVMRSQLGVVAVALLLAAATLQVAGIPWAVHARSSLGQSLPGFTSFYVPSRSGLSAQASTCPYEVTPVAIASATLEPMLHHWKTLLDQSLANRNYGTPLRSVSTFLAVSFILRASKDAFHQAHARRRRLLENGSCVPVSLFVLNILTFFCQSVVIKHQLSWTHPIRVERRHQRTHRSSPNRRFGLPHR